MKYVWSTNQFENRKTLVLAVYLAIHSRINLPNSRFSPKELLMMLSGSPFQSHFWFVAYILDIRSVDVEIIRMNPYKTLKSVRVALWEPYL